MRHADKLPPLHLEDRFLWARDSLHEQIRQMPPDEIAELVDLKKASLPSSFRPDHIEDEEQDVS